MLNKKSFLNKKTLTILISAVVILGALIAVVATGAAHHACSDCAKLGEVLCAECNGSGIINQIACESCGGILACPDCLTSGVVEHTCASCEGLGTVICETCAGSGKIFSSLWALLPPIIAIGLALITKEVFSSLFIGILSGAIIAADFAPLNTVDHVVSTGLISAFSDTAGIFIFLIELGILVCLVNRAGGSRAFGEWAKTHVKTKVGAALCTFVLGILIFIDDYFNCLTVGSVMRPVTDKHKISRSKLAYLIDATAAPICMIAPISSWAAAVSKYVAEGQGFSLFIMAIPMNFYSILTLVFILGLTLMKFDFGLMRKHEINAENGDLFSGKQIVQEETTINSKGKVIDLIIPVALLIVSCIGAIIYNGICGGATNFTEWFSFTDSTVALPWGGLVGLILSIIYLAVRKVVSFKESMDSLPKGFIAMVPAILILTFATALKNITGILGAAEYIAQLMEQVPATIVKLLPAIIFVVACLLSFSTGTSWGTFGILIPIVTAMFNFKDGSDIANVESLMIVGISACLAGAVCGDHCSPISDTTIMSSAGAECEHLNHVSTQIPYAIFVAGVSFVCFIIAGFLPLWYVMLPLSITIMIGAIIVLKILTTKYYAKKDAQAQPATTADAE